MYKYEIIIYWSDEDGVFVAEVPELPGCMSQGLWASRPQIRLVGVGCSWPERERPAIEGRGPPCSQEEPAAKRSSYGRYNVVPAMNRMHHQGGRSVPRARTSRTETHIRTPH